MQLSFEHYIDVGEGRYPQAIHDKTNLFRVIYLAEDDTVHSLDADPVLGIYSDLEFTEKGRVSPDDNVSMPSLKRVAHYGAYGFWSAEGDHRFVIYMMPTDISKALIDGKVTFSVGSEVSSLSCSLINVRGELLNRYRALVTPGTKLEVYFSIGSSEETPLGVFYIDRADVSYPDEKVSVAARNAIGKLLKEQTFDEHNVIDEGSLQENIKKMLEYAEIEHFFVGDAGIDQKLEFEPDTTVLEGIKYAITNLTDWKIGETLDGVVGVSVSTDVRFEIPSIHIFDRDKTCWSYDIDYDDSDAAARVCVSSEGTEEDAPTVRVYEDVGFNKWWEQPKHRTLHVETVKGATEAQCRAVARMIAASLAESGRLETFVGLFTPQLTLSDEAHVIDEKGREEIVGTVTDVSHSFGQGGFYTSFTVDSGGRRSRRRLKDLISSAAESTQIFTGKQTPTADGDEVEY